MSYAGKARQKPIYEKENDPMCDLFKAFESVLMALLMNILYWPKF